MAQVWLITGSSRGLGRALAEAVLAAGHELVATARNPAQLADLVERYGDHVRTVALDVTDAHAARDAIEAAVDAFGARDGRDHRIRLRAKEERHGVAGAAAAFVPHPVHVRAIDAVGPARDQVAERCGRRVDRRRRQWHHDRLGARYFPGNEWHGHFLSLT